MTVVVVSGMPYESNIATSIGDATVEGDAAAIRAALAREPDLSGLISFGVCGALAEGARPGELVIAREVIRQSDKEVFVCDVEWSRTMGGGLYPWRVLGAMVEVTTPEAKKYMAQVYCSSVVDMESHIVGQIAADHKLPFIVIRAVADPYDFTLPPAATIPLNSDGSPNMSAILGSVVTNPLQIPALLQTYRYNKAAVATLVSIKDKLRLPVPTKKYLKPAVQRK